jgi:broad specificity phosphatase PhoE
MTVFYFVRHGRIVKGTAAPPLSPLGREEAGKTAVFLQQQPILHVFASPLQRARETAAIIVAPHHLPVIIEPLLRERVNWGDAPEQEFADFMAMWERSSRERDWQPPVGDSSRAAGQRLEQFIQAQQKQHPQATILAVTHGGVLADFLLNVFTLAEVAAVNRAFVAAPYSGEVMRECALTAVTYNGRSYQLNGIADVIHLV